MSNMSYCHFENTASDLADCVEAQDSFDELFEYGDGSSTRTHRQELSSREESAYLRLLVLADRLLSMADKEDLKAAGVEL